MRASVGGIFGLDFGSIILRADAMGEPTKLLAEMLPAIEPIIVAAYKPDSSE